MRTEERRLIAIGFPADEAICLCYSMRREGTLAKFVEREEQKYYERMAKKYGVKIKSCRGT